MENTKTNTVLAVSYTHLDVYKRQGYTIPDSCVDGCKKCTCTLTLCTTHSNVYYRSTEIRKEAAIQILEQLYDAGRQLSGKSAGSYHAENISGG